MTRGSARTIFRIPLFLASDFVGCQRLPVQTELMLRGQVSDEARLLVERCAARPTVEAFGLRWLGLRIRTVGFLVVLLRRPAFSVLGTWHAGGVVEQQSSRNRSNNFRANRR